MVQERARLDSKDTCILLTRLSILYLARDLMLGRSRRTVYFFDLHARTHGVLTLSITRVMGVAWLSHSIQRAGRFFGLALHPVPHGDAIPDYHALQIRMLGQVTESVEAYFEDAPEGVGETFLPAGTIDSDSESAWILQELAYRFQSIVENILVIRSLGATRLIVWTGRDEYPGRLLRNAALRFDVEFVQQCFDDRFLALLALMPYLAIRLSRNLRRLKLAPVTDRSAGGGQPVIAAEFHDPLCGGRRPTHPKYVASGGFPDERVLAYYRGPHWWRQFKDEPFNLEGAGQVVGLQDLPFTRGELWLYFRSLCRLIATQVRTRKPIHTLLKELENIQLFMELSALFERFCVGIHLGVPFPDGRSALNYCSGVPTAACRRAGVTSIGYQSRAQYTNSPYLFFHAFDVYCAWGLGFIENDPHLQFVRRFETIGNIYLDVYDHSAQRGTRPKGSPMDRAQTLKIVFFTGDVDSDAPLHYTLDYTIMVMKFWLRGLEASARKHPAVRYQVFLKPKNPEYADLLLNHAEIREFIDLPHLDVEALEAKQHDVAAAIQMADVIFAIGFTSPGIEAALLGRPAAYLTPYPEIYRREYSAKPWILGTAEEVVDFMDCLPVDLNSLNEIDPYRDGKAAMRLAGHCFAALGENPPWEQASPAGVSDSRSAHRNLDHMADC